MLFEKMPSGMKLLIRGMGVNIEELEQDLGKRVAQVGQIMADTRDQLNRIEANQAAIMRHLGIEDHGRATIEQRDFDTSRRNDQDAGRDAKANL